MKTFILTVEVPDNNVRDSVHIAQMIREAAAWIEPMIPLEEHRHFYGPDGEQKYEWDVEYPDVIDPEKARVRGR